MTKRWLFVAGLMAVGVLAGCRDGGLSDPFYGGDATPTPTPVVTPTPDPNGNPTPAPTATPSGGSGATMISTSEQVTVIDFATDEFDLSVDIYVQRSNLEVWILTVAQSPSLTLDEAIVYQNSNLIFGSTSGSLLFPNNVREAVTGSVRIQ